MEEVTETSLVLERILRALGDEYGPLGVALAAAELTDDVVLIDRLKERRYDVVGSVQRSGIRVSPDAPLLEDVLDQTPPQPTRPDPGRTERKDGTPPDPDEPGWFDKLKIALRAREQARKARAGKPVSFRRGTQRVVDDSPLPSMPGPPKPPQPPAHSCCSSKGMAYSQGLDPDEPILMRELGTDTEKWV